MAAAPSVPLAPAGQAANHRFSASKQPVNLAPAAVARAFLGDEHPAPAGAHDDSRPDLNADLHSLRDASAAAALLDHSPAAPAIALRRKPGGGYGYVGKGFNAYIDQNGAVVMNDKYGGAAPPLFPVELPDGSFMIGLGGAAFDLTAALDRAFGNDPFRSERRWFFEQTRALREQLAERSAARATQRRLSRLWQTPGKSLPELKRATFDMWAECSDDVIGRRGREVIERWVREHCPEAASRGFSAEELSALNAGRREGARFSPYAESR